MEKKRIPYAVELETYTRLEREMMFAALQVYKDGRTSDKGHPTAEMRALSGIVGQIREKLLPDDEPDMLLDTNAFFGLNDKPCGKENLHHVSLYRIERELLYAALLEFIDVRWYEVEHVEGWREVFYSILGKLLPPWSSEPPLSHGNDFLEWSRPQRQDAVE